MIKLFEHVSTYHRTTETLTIKEWGQGLYVGVNSCEIIPSERVSELNYDEQTTSIVVPLSEITNLIQSLSKVASGWIDTSKQLPEEDGLYLAYYPDQPYKQQIVCFSSNINKFNCYHENITHWQPLPNPPRGK